MFISQSPKLVKRRPRGGHPTCRVVIVTGLRSKYRLWFQRTPDGPETWGGFLRGDRQHWVCGHRRSSWSEAGSPVALVHAAPLGGVARDIVADVLARLEFVLDCLSSGDVETATAAATDLADDLEQSTLQLLDDIEAHRGR
jgi:hypothetical protein